MARIATTAYQRAYAVSLSTLEQMLLQGTTSSDAGVSQQAKRASVTPSSTLPAPTLEPVLRYAASMLGIYQAATVATADLLAAQLRGERQTVDALADQARSQADEAVRDAAAATGSVLSTGFEVASRLTSAAAQVGQGLGAQAGSGQSEESTSRRPSGQRARQASSTLHSGHH